MPLFHIPRMACGGCVAAVIEAIRRVDPAATLQVRPERSIDVASSAPMEALLTALDQANYPATLVTEPAGRGGSHEA